MGRGLNRATIRLMRRVVPWSIVVYLSLLAASHLVRLLPTAPEPIPADMQAADVAERLGTGGGAKRVRIAYRTWTPTTSGGDDLPVVVLLHGSPGSGRDFRTLGPALGARYRVLAPDLPGFGASEKKVPDYSIRAHAAYTLELLDRLGIDAVHLVGFSMGGGVALEMVDQAPDRARSLTLLSAIGVQELELLGDYRLNHAVHGFQVACLWLLRELVPHFGFLDDSFFGLPYARNFYDSDQRPLRRILSRLAIPTLILHGTQDFLVPVDAAREHHRLVPQSELVLYDTSHFMIFTDGDRLAEPIVDFIDRVEKGAGVQRSQADAARVAAADRPFDLADLPRATGLTLWVLAIVIAIATLLTEDFACIGAGLLVAQGRIGFLAATLACFVGIVVGDVLLYWAGHGLGRPWLHRAPIKWFVSSRQVEASTEWFQRRGPMVVFLSRFLPGTRVATYFTAGLLRTGFWRFLLYFILAVAIWTPFLVGMASFVGARFLDYFEIFRRWALPALLGLILMVWVVARVVPLFFTWKGRRRIHGWLCRRSQWEFWPLWFFYLPVFGWIAWLALRYRSLTVFTVANPAIPESGFIGESKSDILDGLDREWVAPYERIAGALPADEKIARVRDFVAAQRLVLPIVLKPDAGQRGNGVKIARDWDQIEQYCATARMDFLVQEFVAGREYGVFYVRLPDQPQGRIFSITDKRLPSVTGDGRRTLEELVLADPRAVCLAPLYLEALGGRCSEIPVLDEEVRLTELGTHCRGAVFLDGGRLLTPSLETAIETMSQSYRGFYFGRYDIRVPSREDLQRGRNLKVVELNGVTSEATHIYDPEVSLWRAYRTLFRQWQLAFETGKRNRNRGKTPATVRSLLRDLVHYRWQRRAARREDWLE